MLGKRLETGGLKRPLRRNSFFGHQEGPSNPEQRFARVYQSSPALTGQPEVWRSVPIGRAHAAADFNWRTNTGKVLHFQEQKG